MNWSSWIEPGQSRSRIEKVISRLIPLPMPRSVICSPSHMTKMAPVVSVTTMMRRDAKPGLAMAPGMRLGEQGEGVGLRQRDEHGEVPGPLRDLLLALLVLLHLADRRGDAAGQLEDDRGRDVGHDAEREHRGPGQAAAQSVVQSEEPGGGGVLDEVGQRGDVHSRRGDVGADPVDDEREEREQELALQLLVDGQTWGRGVRSLTPRSCRRPPRSSRAPTRKGTRHERCRPGRRRRCPGASRERRTCR